MKKLIITILFILALSACAAALISCSPSDVYSQLAEDGYTVKVTFDAGGAVINDTQDVTIVEMYSASAVTFGSDGDAGIRILAPDDPRRGADGIFKLAKSDTENYYFTTGWYTERTPRTDAQGNALDAYGEPVAVSGREQGYVYSGRWDFERDRLDPSVTEFTLYAAWIPFFNYEFYAEGESGEYELIGSANKIDLNVPEWNERTGKLNMNDISPIDGKTFSAAYLDAEKTLPLTDKIDGDAEFVDVERGISTRSTVKIYTTWQDGVWQRIYSPDQLTGALAVDPNGNYLICNDLDMSGAFWPASISSGEFCGTISGGGHTVSNISLTQNNYNDVKGGLFGSIGDGALIENVSFSDVSYTLLTGSRTVGASFGLLCGSISDGARLDGVTVSGEIVISDDCCFGAVYNLGLVSGGGNVDGIDPSGIQCIPENADSDIVIDIDEKNGRIIISH